MSITLTKSQKSLVTDIKDWHTNNKSLAYTISGQAGTGKSFITNYIVKNILKGKRIAVAAPTHKAVKIISDFSGLKGYTLHSLHGLRPNFSLVDFNVDKIKFEALGTNKFIKYNIILCDESSMISTDIYKLNNIRSLQYNTKIIYIGDKLQLPPITNSNNKLEISPVFNNKYKYELIDIVRQSKTNSLHKLFILLRGDILNGTSTFINYLNGRNYEDDITDGIGYKILNIKNSRNSIIGSFQSDEFKSDSTSYKIGSYTNDRVTMWNKFIRHSIMGDDKIIKKGDILMGYKTIVDEYLSPIVINSSDYIVIDCYEKNSDFGFKIFVTSIKDLTYGFMHTINIVDHTDRTFIIYKQKIAQLQHNAIYSDLINKGETWKMYYNFKDLYITMTDFDILDSNRNKISTIHKELDYGYAVTIHKLQGSTIKNMFIDALDIIYYKGHRATPRHNINNNSNIIEIRNRMLYTGLSRISEKAIILF